MKLRSNILLTLIYVLLIAMCIVTLIPIIYTVMASMKTNIEIFTKMGDFFPETFNLDNYRIAMKSENFYIPELFKNSVIFTIFYTLGNVFVAAMAGYAFEKGEFPFKKLIFTCFTLLLFVRLGGISIYATFDVLNFLHIKRNLYTLILIQIFTVHIVNIYLVKGYVKSLPSGILEAAQIDGCSFFRTFWNIALPIIKPIIATISILSIKAGWNEYILPNVFTLTKPHQRTMMVGLMALKTSEGDAAAWNLMLAGSVVSMIPIFIAYIFCNKYFVRGLSAGAEKG